MKEVTILEGQGTNTRSYKEERFELALFVNNNLICKRNFRINDFIEHSMESEEFKNEVDKIVNAIKNDLASKSRVYTWYYFNPNDIDPEDEFNTPLIEPWKCTFKFVITDRRRPVITRIWDGSVYPRAIREKVDIVNKSVKVFNEKGEMVSVDKEEFFKKDAQKLTFDQQVLKAQILDKGDLLLQITKGICEVCSPSGGEFKSTKDYTLVSKVGDKNYKLSLAAANEKVEQGWANMLKKKTDDYFKNLFR